MVALLCSPAAAQQPEAPRAKAPPASPLYALALDEWHRARRAGAKLPRAERPGPGMPRRWDELMAPEFGPEWDPVLKQTVLARDLFRQAAAAPIGTLAPATMTSPGQFARRLQELSDLVLAGANERMVADPHAGITASITLLRHARHLWSSRQPELMLQCTRTQQRAAGLLAEHLPRLPATPRKELLSRCATELALHAAQNLDHEAITQSLHRAVPALMDRHRPRLRDMHQVLPGGYDERAMKQYVLRLIDEAIAQCPPNSTPRAFIRALDQHAKSLIGKRNDDATITEKAARGLIPLLAASIKPIGQAQPRAQAALDKQRKALRKWL